MDSCDRLNLEIHGADAISLAQKYRAKRDGHTAEKAEDQSQQQDRVPFSKEAFLDALTDFIIADDVVC